MNQIETPDTRPLPEEIEEMLREMQSPSFKALVRSVKKACENDPG